MTLVTLSNTPVAYLSPGRGQRGPRCSPRAAVSSLESMGWIRIWHRDHRAGRPVRPSALPWPPRAQVPDEHLGPEPTMASLCPVLYTIASGPPTHLQHAPEPLLKPLSRLGLRMETHIPTPATRPSEACPLPSLHIHLPGYSPACSSPCRPPCPSPLRGSQAAWLRK